MVKHAIALNMTKTAQHQKLIEKRLSSLIIYRKVSGFSGLLLFTYSD